jgi:hypothetical protein
MAYSVLSERQVKGNKDSLLPTSVGCYFRVKSHYSAHGSPLTDFFFFFSRRCLLPSTQPAIYLCFPICAIMIITPLPLLRLLSKD